MTSEENRKKTYVKTAFFIGTKMLCILSIPHGSLFSHALRHNYSHKLNKFRYIPTNYNRFIQIPNPRCPYRGLANNSFMVGDGLSTSTLGVLYANCSIPGWLQQPQSSLITGVVFLVLTVVTPRSYSMSHAVRNSLCWQVELCRLHALQFQEQEVASAVRTVI